MDQNFLRLNAWKTISKRIIDNQGNIPLKRLYILQ